MKSPENLDILTHLISALSEISKKLRKAYEEKNIEELNKAKEEMLKLQKKIGEITK